MTTLICIICHQMEDEDTDDTDVAGLFIHEKCVKTPAGMVTLVNSLKASGFRPPLSIKLKILWYKIKLALHLVQ